MERGTDPGRDAAIAARNERVLAYQGMVKRIALRAIVPGVDFEDLKQRGTMGLMRAADKFDPSRGLQFTTYAYPWIRRFVHLEVAETLRPVRVPDYAGRVMGRFQEAAGRIANEAGAVPADDAVLDAMHVTEKRRRTVLDILITSRATVGDGTAWLTGPEDDEGEVDGDGLRMRLGRLDERSRRVLVCRYGLDGEKPMSLTAVGRRLGMTKSLVQQVQAAALVRLRGMYSRERP